MTAFLDTAQGRRIAYVQTPGSAPGVVFLGGFRSDMEGTKALHLETMARARGQAFLRFDYSGHGQSSGAFEEGSIGDWAADAAAAIIGLTEGPQILVGSSMGGWIASLFIRDHPERVAGFVGIAAAPDFTEDSIWAGFDADQRRELAEAGHVSVPSDYGEPYIITKRLIEEGRHTLVLRDRLTMPFPVRLFQGTADADVELDVALGFLDHIEGDDVRLMLVKGADHRFSTPECLALIDGAVADVTGSLTVES
ncbi:MAG: alpha/beta hydrolase [Pseudomonadota bacterium]